jgi:hypothetical protein
LVSQRMEAFCPPDYKVEVIERLDMPKTVLLLTALAVLAVGLSTAYPEPTVESLLAGIRANIAASDWGRRNPSLVDGKLTEFQEIAVEVRREQNNVIPVESILEH